MEPAAQEQIDRYVTYAGLTLSPIALGVSYVLVEAQGLEKAFFSPLGICGLLTIGPAVLRLLGQSPLLIVVVAALNLGKPNKSGVYLTPQGIFVLTAICLGSYYLICDMLARALVGANAGRLVAAGDAAGQAVASDPGAEAAADAPTPPAIGPTQES